jgi:hypothetical protein
MMAPVLVALSMLGQARDAQPAELIPLLTSTDRVKRYEAAVALTKLQKVPGDAVEAIVAYLKLEVTQAMLLDGYMRRFDGAALAERITRVEERQHSVAMAVRLRCVIHRERLEGDLSEAVDSIEVTDWQALSDDVKSWMPWTFEGIGLGYKLMSKAGNASTSTCLET